RGGRKPGLRGGVVARRGQDRRPRETAVVRTEQVALHPDTVLVQLHPGRRRGQQWHCALERLDVAGVAGCEDGVVECRPSEEEGLPVVLGRTEVAPSRIDQI